MYAISEDTKIRFTETLKLIRLLTNSEDHQSEVKDTSTNNCGTIIKSSIILTLYNVIESTTSCILKKIHNDIISEKLRYHELSKEIQILIITYYHKHNKNIDRLQKPYDSMHEIINLIKGDNFFNLKYDTMENCYALYSGNLYENTIRKVMKNYNIFLKEGIGKSLTRITKGRNLLAHGNQSFSEYGRNITVQEIEALYHDSNSFLTDLIHQTENYLKEKRYKKVVQKSYLNNKQLFSFKYPYQNK